MKQRLGSYLHFAYFFSFLGCSFGILRASSTPLATSCLGYPCLVKVFCNFLNFSNFFCSSSTMAQMRPDRLKGMLRLVWLGWHELNLREHIVGCLLASGKDRSFFSLTVMSK